MKTHFLQSKEWEGFQHSLGRDVFRIEGVLITKLPLTFGKSYFYVAGAQFLNNFQNSNFQTLAKQHNAVFLKWESMNSSGTVPDEFRKSKKEIQPQKTIILDLSTDEDKLLSAMHEKTRYNIRLAQKKGLEIKNYEKVPIEVFEEFWQVLQKTSGRDKFSSHTKEYYKKLLELPSTRLFVAKHKGGMIAANIILFYGDTVYYLHGASDYEYRSLMAPYILHWEIIKYAKGNRFNEYDLWGIDEKKWPGVTRFKKGFGGREVEYAGSYDYVFQPFWYKLYNLYRKLKTKS